MKINYQIKLEEEIKKNSNKMPTLLLHSCCAPCSSYVLKYLSKYFKITIFYYNPNINTKEEFQKRSKEQIRLIKEMTLENDVEYIIQDYNYQEYENKIKGLEQEKEGGKRCYQCYYLREEQTAIYAKEHNYDYFTTTLSISPYKNSTWINQIGEELSKKYNIKYLYADFKKKDGYKQSIKLSKKYNLYRQNYCGCIYSKKEKETNKV